MIGLEPTFDEHLENLVEVFREVKRVLRKDGTLWLNYGDAYAASSAKSVSKRDRPEIADYEGTGFSTWGSRDVSTSATAKGSGLKPKDLMMMPARVAMALQADGWWLRSEIIYFKSNPMPESCRDRPTSAHEKLFLLSKSAKYFYDSEAVRVPSNRGITCASRAPERNDNKPWMGEPESSGHANLRNVWKIATFPYPGAHFATFPPKLVEPCIKAGTSEKGCCSECGAPLVRETRTVLETDGRRSAMAKRDGKDQNNQGVNRFNDGHLPGRNHSETTGWNPTCDHDNDPVPCVCLDPFSGAGTVGLVAHRLQRDAVLIEISPEYAEMSRKRIHGDMPLFADVKMEG